MQTSRQSLTPTKMFLINYPFRIVLKLDTWFDGFCKVYFSFNIDNTRICI